MPTSLIGGVVGEISARSTATSTVTDRGQGVDFTIGSLAFKMAASDERPYERATAQFKKEQFDSAPTPGEQALTGWWMRSQASFHRGAGLKYYEVLDGETILNRYSDSTGVNPWEPGEVALPGELVNRSASSYKDAVARYSTADAQDMVYAVTSAGAVNRVTASAVTALTSGVATTVAANSRETFITTTNKVQRLQTGTTFSDLLTNTAASDSTFVGVWWAKGRLFAVDAGGRWYAKANTVASFNETTAFWASGITSAEFEWTVAETPGPVFMARDATIYAVTPSETDGAVPTLTAPLVAGELPPGEVVRAMRYTAGHLVIVTSGGVRLAEVSAEGRIAYGPPLVEFTSSTCRKVGAWGSVAYVTGKGKADTTECVYEVELAGVGDLIAPYARRTTYSTTNTGSGTATVGGLLATFGDEGVQIESTVKEPSGILTTGFHRYGTLEPKKFHSVRVRIGGDAGLVKVTRVMSDLSEVDVYTLDAATTDGDEISLGLQDVQEMLALKFTLTRSATDTTKGPTLLGYQLRALPAPKRQRLIRVPLELFNTERAGGARASGYIGSAWSRLQALEDMESTGGTFQFRDFRTGEAGECFIESVEHIGTTAPGRNDTGFGGVVLLTLRKL